MDMMSTQPMPPMGSAPPAPLIEPAPPVIGKRRIPSARKEAEILEAFDRHFNAAKAMRSSVVDMAMKAHRQYCCIMREEGKSKFFLRVHDPHFFATVTAQVASEAGALLSNPQILQYAPRGATSDEMAKYFTAAFDYHWNENPRCRAAIIDMSLQSHLYGTSLGVCYWHEDWRKFGYWKESVDQTLLPSIDEFGGLSMAPSNKVSKEFVVERRKAKDSPWFKPLNFFSCYPDSEAETVRDGRWFIYHERVSLSHVKSQRDSGAWGRRACNDILADPSEYSGRYHDERIREMLSSEAGLNIDPGVDEKDPLIDVYEYFTPEGRATVVNGMKVVAFHEGYVTGYYPIIHLRNHPTPGEFWGMSDLQIIESNILALQNIASAQATEVVLNIFRPLIVSDPGINLKEFRWEPGKVLRITSGDANAIKPMPMDPSGIQIGSQYTQEQRARIDIAVGASDVTRGSLPTRSQSATAVMQSTQHATLRQGPRIIELEDGLIRPIGENFRALIACCQSDDITARLPGSDAVVEIKAEMLNADLDLSVVPITGAQRMTELEQKRMLELGNLAMNFQVPTFNREEFIRMIAESLIPRIADRIIMSPEQAQQQMMMQQMMAMQQQGGPGPGNGSPGAVPVSNQVADMGGATELSREQGGEVAL